MAKTVKIIIKKALASIGLINPAMGVKISPEAKAAIILEYKRPEIDTFVETGTEFGTMIDMVGDQFEKIYSIEYDTKLYDDACKKFSNRNNIVFIHGDSGLELKKVVAELHKPVLFWLDAHGTGSMTVKNPRHCPVEKELQSIFEHNVRKHVIIIDDVRHFDRYTISVIKDMAKRHGYSSAVVEGLFILK